MRARFEHELERIRGRWRRGLAASVLLESAAGLAAGLTLLGAADLLLALESGWRLSLFWVVAGAALLAAGRGLLRILALGPREAAEQADRLAGSRRREVLTAHELLREAAPEAGTLGGYFTDAAVEAAVRRMETAPDPFPAAIWRRARNRALLALAAAALPALIAPRAFLLEAGRLLAPYADLPPYSRLVFTVTPEAPRVVYGSDQVVGVTITGGALREPVRFVTRQGGRVRESACFQASATNFAQRLERVMQPVEFGFRCGRARSRWHALEVLYEPVIESAALRLVPPAYSRKPVRAFSLGAEPLAGLRGTRVELTVRSNRPLKGGILTVTPQDGAAPAHTVEGSVTNRNGLAFAWTLERPARLALTVRDAAGTASREPLRALQLLTPDEPPRVTLTTPALYSLATPSVAVPVEGDAQDDLGLLRADLYRGVMGYRPRGESVTLQPGAVLGEVTGRLDLARLGVTPGEVIEVMAEASDTNPDLTGIGASAVARIQVISEEEYAELVRARMTLEAFQERFAAAAERQRRVREALEAAREAIQAGSLAGEAAAEKMKEMEALVRETAAGLRELAESFSAYDLEKKLAAAAEEAAGGLESALAAADWKAGDAAGRVAALEKALAACGGGGGGGGGKLQEAAAQAEESAAVGRLMALAAGYKALLERQETLVRRLERYAAGERQTLDAGVLAKTQDAIRADLEALMEQLDKRAQALPDEYVELRTSALDFLYALRGLEIPPVMTDGAAASRNDRGREAWTLGLRALEKMRELVSRCGGSEFGGMCDGQLRFKVSENLAQTMAQMMKALMQQAADGVGQGLYGGAGIGAAGTSEGSMDGYAGVNVPLYGPARNNPFPAGAGREGRGAGAGGGGGPGKETAVREVVKGDDTRTVNGAGVTLEAVPVRYREAVKAFYGGKETP